MEQPLNEKLDAYLAANYDGTGDPKLDAFVEKAEAEGEFRHFLPEEKERSLGKLLDKLLQRTSKSFSEKLLALMKKRGIPATQLYQKAGLTKAHFSKIKNQKNYQPSKDTAMALAVALGLSLKEAQDLIGTVGYSFSRGRIRDIVVEFFLQEGIYDLDELNLQLYNRGEKPLCKF